MGGRRATRCGLLQREVAQHSRGSAKLGPTMTALHVWGDLQGALSAGTLKPAPATALKL